MGRVLWCFSETCRPGFLGGGDLFGRNTQLQVTLREVDFVYSGLDGAFWQGVAFLLAFEGGTAPGLRGASEDLRNLIFPL